MIIDPVNHPLAFFRKPVITPELTLGLPCDTSRRFWAISSEIADAQEASIGETVGIAFRHRVGSARSAQAIPQFTCTFSATGVGCKARGILHSKHTVVQKAFDDPYSGYAAFSGLFKSSGSGSKLETVLFRNLAIAFRFGHGKSLAQPGADAVRIFSGPTRSRDEAQRRVEVLERAFRALEERHRVLSRFTFQLPGAEQLLSA